jgi:hypothetical protein
LIAVETILSALIRFSGLLLEPIEKIRICHCAGGLGLFPLLPLGIEVKTADRTTVKIFGIISIIKPF